MSLPTAQALAWSLATSLMACITIFRAADGYSVVPSAEFDGDAESVIHEYDPFSADRYVPADEPQSRFAGSAYFRFCCELVAATLITKRHGGGGDAPDCPCLGASS